MPLIYRVEHHKTRIGPFQTPDPFTQELAEKTKSIPHLKVPGEDGIDLYHLPWAAIFGCLNLADLKKWFLLGETPEDNTHIVARLSELGFVVAEYCVDRTDCWFTRSRQQVAFMPRFDEPPEYSSLETLLTPSGPTTQH